MDASTKDELHMVEVEGQDTEGQKIKAVLVSLKPSTLPSVSELLLVISVWTFLIPQPPTNVGSENEYPLFY